MCVYYSLYFDVTYDAALGQGVSVEPFHRERLELTEEKVAYRKHGDEALLEVR